MRVIVVIHKGQGNKLLVSNEPAEPIVKDTVSKAEGGGACLERCAKYRGFPQHRQKPGSVTLRPPEQQKPHH